MQAVAVKGNTNDDDFTKSKDTRRGRERGERLLQRAL